MLTSTNLGDPIAEGTVAGIYVGDGIFLRGADEPAPYPITIKVIGGNTHPH